MVDKPRPPLPEATALDGTESFVGRQGGILKRFMGTMLKGQKGDKGDPGTSGKDGTPGTPGKDGAAGKDSTVPGPAGTPKRVERYTATTNTSGVATFTFSLAFAAAPDVDVVQGWIGDQEVGGAPSSITATGCTVLVKVSRATLLLSAGPYQTAGSGVSVTIRCIGN